MHSVLIDVPNELRFVDDGEHDADADDISEVIQAHINEHAVELAEKLQAYVDDRRADDFIEPDESDLPYSDYEEGKALDEYEHSHGW
jgi:hypothetical protein